MQELELLSQRRVVQQSIWLHVVHVLFQFLEQELWQPPLQHQQMVIE